MKVEASANANRPRKLPKLSEWGFEKSANGQWKGESMLGVTLNLLMCDRRGAVYSVQAITSKKYKYSLIDLFYFVIDCYILSVLN